MCYNAEFIRFRSTDKPIRA